MLETLEDPNIRNMSVEEPEKKESGWVEILEELTEDDIKQIQNKVTELRHAAQSDEYDWAELPRLVSDIRTLGIETVVTTDDFKSLETMLNKYRVKGQGASLLHLGAGLKLLEGNSRLTSSDLSYLYRERKADLLTAENSNHGSVLLRVVNMLRNFRIIGENIPITPLETEYIQRRIDRSRLKEINLFAYWTRVADELGLTVEISPEDIKRMQDKLQEAYEEKWGIFIELAGDMKYLSERFAKPNTDLSKVPAPPEERKF